MLYTSFKLSKEFINSYKDKKVNFGFNGLGELTYYRTYSRLKADGTNEHYFETVERVVNTIFSIYLEHLVAKNILHDKKYMNELAEEMYDAIFTFKFTPSGRGFWALVPELLEKVGGMPLHNCMFVSTVPNVTKAFCTMMNASMLGVGVGFDTKAENKIKVNVAPSPTKTYVIPDTREGWVKSLKLLINSYLLKGSPSYKFDYKDIRPAGTPIKNLWGDC
jgi:ribonucleoside-triphosphate reductase